MEGALLGAGLGAGTGALGGSLSGRAGAGTAIGAGAGALIGGIMGYQAEQSEKQRQAQPPAYPPTYATGGTGSYPVNQQYNAYPNNPYYPQRQAPVPQSSVRSDQSQTNFDTAQTATAITTVVNCPRCNQSLDVTEFRKGSKVRCPACNNVFVY